MLAKRASRRRSRGENTSYWMSYSDMLSALLLMFVLLLFLALNSYQTLQETKAAELAAQEQRIQEQAEQALQQQADLDRQERELAAIRSALNTERIANSEKELELDQQRMENEYTKAELEQSLAQLILQKAQIEEQERLLALSEEEIENARRQLEAYSKDLDERELVISAKDAALLIEQLRVSDLETLLNDQKEQMEEQAAMIDELVGVRSRIIEQLRDAFADAGVNVAVDRQTGALTIDSTVFFDTDQDYLKPDGREMLLEIFPIYFRTLMSPENAEYVSEIIIEGHTDSDGTYLHNLELSQRRALAVILFCMSDQFTSLTAQEKTELSRIISSTGRSETQLIYDQYGVEDKAASRRVEIKFRLKDEEMIESMNRILTEMDD